MKYGTAFCLLIVLAIGCKDNTDKRASPESTPANDNPTTPVINYAVTASYPHDTSSYTEGLLIHNGQLYESTGYDSSFPSTRSLFGVIDLKTGRIEVKAELDKHKYFGEGIVFLNDKLYQLTYTTKVGFIYDAKTFRKTGEFHFPSEQGWGMTTDGTSLIMSDGTNRLTYLNPVDFKPTKTITVTDENGPAYRLNELEMINGFVYANVYTSNLIVKIDTANGNVVGRLNLSSLAEEAAIKYPGLQQLNGIAYDSANGKIYVTGKLWPVMYEITFGH